MVVKGFDNHFYKRVKAVTLKQSQARETRVFGILADGVAAIFPMADFLTVTTKKTTAVSRKNPARGLGGDNLNFPTPSKILL